MEPQNIYDDPDFFAGYSTLERFGAGWERAMEQWLRDHPLARDERRRPMFLLVLARKP